MEEQLNVCLLNDSFPPIIDGVANAVVNYAKNIQRQGGTAMVVTPAYPEADDSHWEFPVVRYPAFDVRKVTSGYMVGIPFYPELSSYLSTQKVDIIHAHCPMMSAVLGRALYKRIQAPMIMTYHTKYDVDIANVVKSKPLQASGIKSVVTNVSSYDEVWTVSHGAGENLRSLGYQGDYIVMPNGVDLSRREAGPEQVEAVTRGYDLPEGIPVFLFVGRLMWYKGIRITLNALRKLKEKDIDYRMVIIGSGGDEEEIKAYTNALGIEHKVFFTGAITDRERIRAWYTRADLFLFPSTFDSNGLVVREAAACNLASVLIRGSCAAEGTEDGVNAFLIEETDQSMEGLLMQVISHPEKMKETGIHAGKELYLSWEDAVAQAVNRYHVVQELYQSGAYKEHDTFSDNLLATNGDLMYTVAKVGQALNQGKVIAQYYFRKIDGSHKVSDAASTFKRVSKGAGYIETRKQVPSFQIKKKPIRKKTLTKKAGSEKPAEKKNSF